MGNEERDTQGLGEGDAAKGNDDTFRDIANLVCSQLAWVDDGAVMNNDVARMNREQQRGSELFENIRKTVNSLTRQLEKLTAVQAKVVWYFNGATIDDDEARQRDDYMQAKRYIGFLIANTVLNRCKRNDFLDGAHCFDHLRMEYFDYLESLSVEEYIRFAAYLDWDAARRKHGPSADFDSEVYYYKSMKCLQDTMWNCSERDLVDARRMNAYGLFKDYFKTNNNWQALKEIKTAKINSIYRNLGSDYVYIRSLVENCIENYVENLYGNLLQKDFASSTVDARDVNKFYRHTIQYPQIVNMAEFFMRCFLCAHATPEILNETRKASKLPLLNVEKKCPVGAI